MARQLGARFLGVARAPLHEAERELESGALEAALAELTRERLIGAVRRAVEQVAKAAGVAVMQVFGRLPMADLEEQVDQLEANQFLVTEALGATTASPIGSPATTASDTGQPRLIASHRLRTLAAGDTVGAGSELGSALQELADDVERWHRALERCEALLDDASDLTRRFRRRRLTRGAVLAIVPLTLGGSGAWFGHEHLMRSRIDAKLAQGPCAAERLDDRDLAQTTPQQRQRIERNTRACRQQREAEQRQRETRRRAEAKRAAADKAVQERLERCNDYGLRFLADQLNKADDELAGAHAELVRRLAQGTLKHEDVEAQLDPLFCQGTPAAEAIGTAMANRVVADAPAWLATRTPSQSVRQLVIDHREAVDREALKRLGGHIDVAARQAVRSGQKRDIERFAALCRWKRALSLPQFGNCIAVLQLAAAK